MSASAVITARPSVTISGLGPKRDRADPCTVVIFGAMGDLTKRKLMPALYELMKEGLVDPEFAVLGVGRESCDNDDMFRARMREAIEQYLFEERRDVLRLVTSTARPDEDARQKISVVQQRLVTEYGYDEHSAKEALSYVTTLLAQE